MDEKIRFIPTLFHGVVDYVFGIALITLAYVYHWQGAQFWVAVIIGAAVIVMSLFTDYEVAVVRFLRIRFHLLMDAVAGVILLASPLLFHFQTGSHRWPYAVFGALAVLMAIITKKTAHGSA